MNVVLPAMSRHCSRCNGRFISHGLKRPIRHFLGLSPSGLSCYEVTSYPLGVGASGSTPQRAQRPVLILCSGRSATASILGEGTLSKLRSTHPFPHSHQVLAGLLACRQLRRWGGSGHLEGGEECQGAGERGEVVARQVQLLQVGEAGHNGVGSPCSPNPTSPSCLRLPRAMARPAVGSAVGSTACKTESLVRNVAEHAAILSLAIAHIPGLRPFWHMSIC